MRHAAIIGGGIGGLTTALALRSQSWTVTVYESARTLKPVGSGLAIAPNALRALDTIGVGDPVRRLSSLTGPGGLRRPSGAWLSRVSAELVARRFGDPTVVLQRAELIDLLAERLTADELRLGVRAEAVDARRGRLATGTGAVDADLIVAADGIRSKTREFLFPELQPPVYCGATAWRVIAPPPAEAPAPAEYWGRGAVVGVIPLADGRVYTYAMARAGEGRAAPDDERRELLRRFGSWAPPIPDLFAAADPREVLRNDIHFTATPPSAFHSGRVALLGDAAHAMTPNVGQGACQAIEDAIVLAHEVTHGDGLEGYTRARLPRTSMVVSESAKVARLAMLDNRLAVAARDTAMWLAGKLGPGPVLKRAERLFGWRPPTRNAEAAHG